MEIVVVLVALCFSYGLGRKHGSRSAKRRLTAFMNELNK